MMKHSLLTFSLTATLLCSCMVSHQVFYERAFQYDGISISTPNAYYRHNGKLYVQGQRSAMRSTRRSPWLGLKEAIIGPGKWQYAPLPGSEYGALLYHEVTLDREYTPQLYLTDNGCWQELNLSNAQLQHVKIGVPSHLPDDSTRQLNWHATYALPAAAVSALAVDLPITLAYYASVPFVFAGNLIFGS